MTEILIMDYHRGAKMEVIFNFILYYFKLFVGLDSIDSLWSVFFSLELLGSLTQKDPEYA